MLENRWMVQMLPSSPSPIGTVVRTISRIESTLSTIFPNEGRRKHIFSLQWPTWWQVYHSFSVGCWFFRSIPNRLFILPLLSMSKCWMLRTAHLWLVEGLLQVRAFSCTVSWHGCLPRLDFLLILIPSVVNLPWSLLRLRSPCSGGRP